MIATALFDPSQHLFWLGSRSLGVVALLLASTSVGLGLALSSRIDGRPGSAARLKVLHESVALISLVAIAGHGLLLLGDGFLHPTLAQITVPFLIDRHRFWTGVGVVTGWLAFAFALSFYFRRRIGVSLWRRLHRWTFVVFVLGIAHALGTGTDSRSTWLLVLLGLAGAPVILLAARRLATRERSVRIPSAEVASGYWKAPRTTKAEPPSGDSASEAVRGGVSWR